ncbi:hypothetical protein B0H13DRAFT_1923032 [Mycena leptocephala]|nr:hypothetical protein B0H13DRAFT_1923032 [Mycena leptocephala]
MDTDGGKKDVDNGEKVRNGGESETGFARDGVDKQSDTARDFPKTIMTSERDDSAPIQLDSPPAHLSSTNNPPSEPETSEIWKTIRRRRARVAHLQNFDID